MLIPFIMARTLFQRRFDLDLLFRQEGLIFMSISSVCLASVRWEIGSSTIPESFSPILYRSKESMAAPPRVVRRRGLT